MLNPKSFRATRNRRRKFKLSIPQPPELQRIGKKIDAAMIFTWADLVNVHDYV